MGSFLDYAFYAVIKSDLNEKAPLEKIIPEFLNS